MGILSLAIILAIIIIPIVAIYFLIDYFKKKKKASNLKNHLKKNFPDFPVSSPILEAKQKDKEDTDVKDIALMIDMANRRLILLFVGKKISHKAYSFNNLVTVKSSEKIYPSSDNGIWYVRYMMLKFSDGSKYNFISHPVADKEKTGNSVKKVKDEFAPWEEKLNEIIK